MKTTKRILAMVLAVIMVMSLATTAFAADGNTITINNSTDGYEYEAYQIFDGTLSSDGKLSDVVWGSGIDSTKTEALMTALKAMKVGEATPFAECADAAAVAEKLADTSGFDNATAQAFADVVSAYLSTTKTTSVDAGETYTISGLDDGYYLVKNTKVPVATEETPTGSYTRYILQVVEDVTVSHKGTVPSVEKDILDTDDDGTTTNVDENEAAIGDTIKYEITGTLPSNITEYDTYFYKFTDTLSAGLTYDNTLVVKVNDVDVTNYFYHKATPNEDGTTTLIVAIEDLMALKNVTGVGTIDANTTIVVTYEAILNEKAIVGTTGNENKVDLEYSNDPNNDGDGSNNPPPPPGDEEPESDYPTGKTPESEVYTYTTEIIINKVDQDQNPLTGAAFTLKGTKLNKVLVTTQKYVEDAAGEYYGLTDGTYTTEAPDGDAGDENYVKDSEGNYAKYTLKNVTEVETVAEEVTTTAYVGEDGKLVFTGLAEGEYTITEVVTPEGYNSIDPITVTITWSADGTNCTWTYEWNPSEVGEGNKATIENRAGSVLPETGGMGTTLFYIFGGIMMLAAVVLLVTKKRMNIAE